MKKRGISSLVSVILLLAMAISMGAVIFSWSKGITGEAVTISGQNIVLVCNDILFEYSYDSQILYIINTGNIDIYEMSLVLEKEESSEVVNLKELTNKWPETGLSLGGIFYDTIVFEDEIQKIQLVPILLGKTESGKFKEHVCENQRGIIELK